VGLPAWMALVATVRGNPVAGRISIKLRAGDGLCKFQLMQHPLCKFCLERGIVTAANVVDHVVPHKGNWTAFVTGKLQSLCEPCHKSAKRQIESPRNNALRIIDEGALCSRLVAMAAQGLRKRPRPGGWGAIPSRGKLAERVESFRSAYEHWFLTSSDPIPGVVCLRQRFDLLCQSTMA
jgi:hypothetical protein